MKGYVIALDQGTTSSRAIVFDAQGAVVSLAQRPFPQIYPRPGWVEHDPYAILSSQLEALSEAFAKSGLEAEDIAAIGVTNQRETTIVWDRQTGKPVYNAIVWQCRRTAVLCDQLSSEGMGAYIRDKTGLLIDAYFSGTKINWILENVPGARERAERGELLFGNVDSWLIWNLTGGREHISDYSNCSRTMLFDITRLCWDEQLCAAVGVPMEMLPRPVPNSMVYGRVAGGLKGLELLAGSRLKSILEKITEYNNRDARKVIYGNFYVTRNPICPSMLVEMGFISNPVEYDELCSQDSMYQTANAIADALIEYVEE